jgi:HicA toxin of bacterial toxin-antitoxin,
MLHGAFGQFLVVPASLNAHLNARLKLTFSPSGANTHTWATKQTPVRWVKAHGGRHDKFDHQDHPETTLIVPRHREVSPGVARDIAKKAGWIS